MQTRQPLTQKFMDTMSVALRKITDVNKQLQVIAYLMDNYPDQFEEFIEKFGVEKYYQIVPKC